MTDQTDKPAGTPPAHDASWWLLPQQVREIAEVIGLQKTLRMVGALCPPVSSLKPGQTSGRVGIIYLPYEPKGVSFSRLADIVGEASAQALIHEFGGAELRLPPCTAFANRVRDASVRDYWRNSAFDVAMVGWLHDLTERQVRNLCRGEPRLARPAALTIERAIAMRLRNG